MSGPLEILKKSLGLLGQPKSPRATIYDKLYDKITQGTAGKPKDIEYFAAVLPGAETGIIKGDAGSVNPLRSPIFRKHVGYYDRSRDVWPTYGTVHTHPSSVHGQNWMSLPPSGKDWRVDLQMPQGSENLVWHPGSDMLDSYSVKDYQAMQDFAKSLPKVGDELVGDFYDTRMHLPRRIFNSQRYLDKTSEMIIPDQFRSEDTTYGAILRALPLRLRDRGLVSVGNSGTPEEQALIEQFAEDWGKKIGFRKGGLVQIKEHNRG